MTYSIETVHEHDTVSGLIHEDMMQVVLFNDDVNSMEYVILCLMKIFGHTEPLAARIMAEAHEQGKAIAEVEAKSQAALHVAQLGSCGLTAVMEKV